MGERRYSILPFLASFRGATWVSTAGFGRERPPGINYVLLQTTIRQSWDFQREVWALSLSDSAPWTANTKLYDPSAIPTLRDHLNDFNEKYKVHLKLHNPPTHSSATITSTETT